MVFYFIFHLSFCFNIAPFCIPLFFFYYFLLFALFLCPFFFLFIFLISSLLMIFCSSVLSLLSFLNFGDFVLFLFLSFFLSFCFTFKRNLFSFILFFRSYAFIPSPFHSAPFSSFIILFSSLLTVFYFYSLISLLNLHIFPCIPT